MIRRSITALLSLGAVWAAGLSCSSRIEPEFDVEPTLANREEITQAMRAVGAGIEARLVLLVHVDKNGQVADVRIQERSGDAGLDDAAEWIGEQMRFEPARHEGQPVAAWVTVPVTFDVVTPGLRPPRLRNAEELVALIAREHPDLSGSVQLRLRIDINGDVKRVRELQASDREALNAARSLVRRLEFWPALRGFREVNTWINVSFEFDGPDSRVWVEESKSSD